MMYLNLPQDEEVEWRDVVGFEDRFLISNDRPCLF